MPTRSRSHTHRRVLPAIAGLAVLGLATSCSTGSADDQSKASAPADKSSPPAKTAARTDYAPYVSAVQASDTDSTASPDTYNLAFVVAAGASECKLTWGGTADIDNENVGERIAALTEDGADVRVSFGGAAGTEAALACDSAEELAGAYAEVLDEVGADKADFDIEGDALSDTGSVALRNQALALLQEDRDLDVTYTLPVMPDGLGDDATAVLENATSNGVELSAVNVMAMNYGTRHSGDMGDYAEQAAEATHEQLTDTLDLSAEAAWRALHLTVMIGVNDVAGETFTLEDAESLRSYATGRGIGALSMWASFRDSQCANGTDTSKPDDTCSGVRQDTGAFAEALAGEDG